MVWPCWTLFWSPYASNWSAASSPTFRPGTGICHAVLPGFWFSCQTGLPVCGGGGGGVVGPPVGEMVGLVLGEVGVFDGVLLGVLEGVLDGDLVVVAA